MTRDREASVEAQLNSLTEAFKLAAREAGAQLQGTWQPSRPGPEGLIELANATGVRVRQLRFSSRNWWKGDHGPLVAFRRDGRAVVLLAAGLQGMRLVDPMSGSRSALTREAAAELEPRAHAVHGRLPGHSPKLRDLLAPGLLPARHDLTTLLGASLVLAVLAALGPLVVQSVVDGPGRTSSSSPALMTCAMFLGLALMAALIVRGLALSRLTARLSERANVAVWDRLLRIPVAHFRNRGSGSYAQALGAASWHGRTCGNHALGAALGLPAVVASACVLAALRPELSSLSLVLFSPVLLSPLLGLMGLQTLRRLDTGELQQRASLLDLLLGLPGLRAAGRAGLVVRRWGVERAQATRLEARRRTLASLRNLHAVSWPLLATAVFADAASDPLGNHAALVAFAQAALLLAAVGHAFGSWVAARPVRERLARLLETPIESTTQGKTLSPLQGALAVRGLTHCYPEAEARALDLLSFEIPAGELVALTGPSGSGKSTLLRTLLGFEPAQHGDVLFDGIPLQELDLTALRSQICAVFQEDALWDGVVRGNVAGVSGDLATAWDALRLAAMADEVRSWPMEMQTVVTDSLVSTGQRQRLLLARALARRPRLLMLDEALSAVDEATEHAILRNLRTLGITCLIVSHRASTVSLADRVLVLEDGRLASVKIQPAAGLHHEYETAMPRAAEFRSPAQEARPRLFRRVALDRLVSVIQSDRPGTTATPRRWLLALSAALVTAACALLLSPLVGGS